jgi:hypothetical protein
LNLTGTQTAFSVLKRGDFFMMRKTLPLLMLTVFSISTAVSAQDNRSYRGRTTGTGTTTSSRGTTGTTAGTTTGSTGTLGSTGTVGSPGTVGTTDTGGMTTATAEDVTGGYLKNQTIGISPQLGVMVFNDAAGETSARAAYGLGIDANLAKMMNQEMANIYLGVSTGFIFSHLGDTGSNLFGSGTTTAAAGNTGANAFIIPADIKVGYNISDSFRVSAHGGGNVVYRSFGNAMSLGDSSTVPTSVWRLFPNVGADLEMAVGNSMAILLRPDLTFSPGSEIFTGTAAVSFALS